MATLTLPQTADPFTTHTSNVVPLRSERSSVSVQVGARTRPRSVAFATWSRWDWMEAAVLSALSWLGGFLVEGLIHCAFVNHAGDPKLIQQILNDRKLTAQAELHRAQDSRP